MLAEAHDALLADNALVAHDAVCMGKFAAVIYDAVSAVVIRTEALTQDALVAERGTNEIALAVVAVVAHDDVMLYEPSGNELAVLALIAQLEVILYVATGR